MTVSILGSDLFFCFLPQYHRNFMFTYFIQKLRVVCWSYVWSKNEKNLNSSSIQSFLCWGKLLLRGNWVKSLRFVNQNNNNKPVVGLAWLWLKSFREWFWHIYGYCNLIWQTNYIYVFGWKVAIVINLIIP